MTAELLAEFIQINIPTFDNIKILGEGVAFHYTSHYDKIEANKKFLGAAIDINLDQTQITLPSPPATNDPGVVFAYIDEEEARAEGGEKCTIVNIRFNKAVQATHIQEATMGAPDTILILTSDIVDFTKK